MLAHATRQMQCNHERASDDPHASGSASGLSGPSHTHPHNPPQPFGRPRAAAARSRRPEARRVAPAAAWPAHPAHHHSDGRGRSLLATAPTHQLMHAAAAAEAAARVSSGPMTAVQATVAAVAALHSAVSATGHTRVKAHGAMGGYDVEVAWRLWRRRWRRRRRRQSP